MNFWLVMILGGLATFTIRLSFIWLHGRFELPDWFRRALKFVPAAVFSAIIFPELLLTNGELNLSFGNYRLIAGVLATVVAWRTKNALITVSAGMIILWLFLA